MTGPRQRLDELDAAREKATPGPWRKGALQYVYAEGPGSPVVADEVGSADAALIVAAVNAVPALTSALRAVADLADEWEAEARRHDDAEPVTTEDLHRMILAAKHCRAHARDLRAALAPLAAPDTGDETTPSPTTEKASTPR